MVVVLAVSVISATEWTLCESQEGGRSSRSSEMRRDEHVVASPLLPSKDGEEQWDAHPALF